jgi:ABC-2 type transport system permease protein
MTRLIRAELIKLRTTRVLWWTAAATLLLVVATIALTITSPSSPGDTPLDSGPGVRSVMAAAASGSLLLLLGITSMAGEFQDGISTTTFLVTPNRQRSFLAKVWATMLVGLAVAAAAAVVTLAIAIPWLGAEGISLDRRGGDVAAPLAGSVAITPLAGAIGVSLGALVRNQTAAVVLALVWTVAVESLVAGLVPELFRWLPGGAFAAVTGSASVGETFALAGGLVLSLGYAVGFALVGRIAVLQGTSHDATARADRGTGPHPIDRGPTASSTGLPRWPTQRRLARVDRRATLVLVGELDTILLPRFGRSVAESIPGAASRSWKGSRTSPSRRCRTTGTRVSTPSGARSKPPPEIRARCAAVKLRQRPGRPAGPRDTWAVVQRGVGLPVASPLPREQASRAQPTKLALRTEAVAQTPDEPAGSVLRRGSENGRVVRHASCGSSGGAAQHLWNPLPRAGSTFPEQRLCNSHDDEQEQTVTALLFDDCGCAAGVDRVPPGASLSSFPVVWRSTVRRSQPGERSSAVLGARRRGVRSDA